MMKANYTDCLEEAMFLASDSYSVSTSGVEFSDFMHATACMSQNPYLPAMENLSANVAIN